MKVKEKKLDDGNIKLSATASADEVDRVFNQVEVDFARSLGLHPDPRKTARDAIAEKLKVRDVDAVISAQVVEALVPFALNKCKFTPQYQPQRESADTLRRGKPYAFTLTVAPKPLYKLSSYDPVEVTVNPFVFDDSQVEEQMQQLTQTYPEYVTADAHPVKPGDCCKLALEVKNAKGEIMKTLTSDGRTYVTGQGFMPETFDEQIIGMEVGKTKEFEFQAPDFDDDGNQITGTFSAKVTLIELQEEKTPQLTDEWIAKTMPMYGTVAELRKQVSDNLEAQQRQVYETQVSAQVQAKWAERFEGTIPDKAYEYTAKSIDQSLRLQMQQQGMDFDKVIEQEGGEQNYNMGLMMQARETLRRDYALDSLFDHAGLTITDDDIREACMEINPNNPQGVKQEMEAKGTMFALREIAARIAASKYAVENAKITVREA